MDSIISTSIESSLALSAAVIKPAPLTPSTPLTSRYKRKNAMLHSGGVGAIFLLCKDPNFSSVGCFGTLHINNFAEYGVRQTANRGLQYTNICSHIGSFGRVLSHIVYKFFNGVDGTIIAYLASKFVNCFISGIGGICSTLSAEA